MRRLDNLGIPDTDYRYIQVNQDQDKDNEAIYINNLICDFVRDNNFEPLKNKKFKVEFINYGDTELVYVIKTEDGKLYTMLIGQPKNELGTVKEEFDNLSNLSKNNDFIVKPEYYYSNGEKELMITPYEYQARCIAGKNNKYGMYIPEPYYRFEPFKKEEEHMVNTCMVANLVRAHEDNKGIIETRLGGGDFILRKEYSAFYQTYESLLKNMKLTSVRKLIDIDLKDYLELLRNELSKVTYYSDIKDRDNSIIVNQKNRAKMLNDSIEDGISLGLSLREQKDYMK